MKWICACCLLVLIACREEPPELPLSDQELITILVDLHLAEGAMQRVPAEWKDSIGAEVRARIAVQHGMTPEEIETLIGRLQLVPEKSMMLYDSVIARLDGSKTSEK
ncbi:MAG: hypothetical protein R3301_02535 [Saprospiraceae bacterium]|nr:hypothetical protein [Saprospiraceae bacterium]